MKAGAANPAVGLLMSPDRSRIRASSLSRPNPRLTPSVHHARRHPMDLSNLDLDRLTKDVSGALVEAVSDLVDGAKADVEAFVGDISKNMLAATLAGDNALVEELLGQLELVAEINRVRAEAHAWVVVRNVTKAIFKAATAGAISVLL